MPGTKAFLMGAWLVLVGAGAAGAQTLTATVFAPTAERSLPPIGWVQFCQENPRDCAVGTTRRETVTLNEARWRQLTGINARVNAAVQPITDIDQWGVPERWSYPTEGKGDCEDYVLEKRRQLIAAGWPRQALLITVVRDKRGDGHAVLTVLTDRGDFILDNQEPLVLAWNDTGYAFIKRQSPENQHVWLSMGGVDTRVTAARR
jgi:predicted transglutaminase-like cysteine proteinase